MSGVPVNNKMDFRQVTATLVSEYEALDEEFRDSLNQNAGCYYLRDPDRIDIGYIKKLRLNRDDGCTLGRAVTGLLTPIY